MQTQSPASPVVPASPVLLTTSQAAALLGLKQNTLEIWRVKGRGPTFAKIGSLVRYRMDDVLAYLESCVRTSTSDTTSDTKALTHLNN